MKIIVFFFLFFFVKVINEKLKRIFSFININEENRIRDFKNRKESIRIG